MSATRRVRCAAIGVVAALTAGACGGVTGAPDATTRAERRERERDRQRERERAERDGDEAEPSDDTTVRSDENTAKWTVLVFLASDNNLEAASLLDAAEMLEGSDDELNLIVVHDRSPLDDSTPGYSNDPIEPFGDWYGTRAYQVTVEGFVDLGISQDADMTSTTIYETFTAQVFGQFPSQRQAVFLWSHGGAWRGAMMDDTSNPQAIVSTEEMSEAIARGLQAIGDDRIDVVTYDACLMGELSSISAFADVADYLIASEEVVPGHSLDYSDLRAAAETTDPVTFATTLVDGYAEHAEDNDTIDRVTMAVVDLGGAAELDSALGDLAAATATLSGRDAITMLRAGEQALRFGGDDFDMIDLGQWAASATTEDPAVNAALTRVIEAVDGAVVEHIEGRAYQGATGIAAYLPSSLDRFDAAYNEVGGTSAVWGEVIDGMYNAATADSAGTAVAFTQSAQAEWQDSAVGVAVEVDPAVADSLVSSTAMLALETPELNVVLYTTPVPQLDSSVAIGGAFRAAGLTLATLDGSTVQLVTLRESSWETTDVLVGTIPVMYTAPDGGSAVLTMVVSLQADAPVGTLPSLQLFAEQENGTLGPVTVDPAGTLDALVITVDADAEVSGRLNSELLGNAPLPADLSQLTLLPGELPVGSTDLYGLPLTAGVRIVNAAGEAALSWARLQ
jgi:hypothetical protein